MAIAGFNPAMEMSQLRTQQTLAMASTSAAAPAAPAASTGEQMAAAAAAPSGPTADAGMAAAAVQEPPSAGKIILQSVLKGALTGASVTMGFKSVGPLISKIGWLSKIVGSIGGAGVIGFLSKVPLVGKLLPLMAKSGIAGFLITAGIGAAVGGIVGAVKGIAASKKAAAEYAEAMAAAQAAQPEPGNPVSTEPTPAPTGAPANPPAAGKPKYKSWIVARSGASGTKGGSVGTYRAKDGDTIAQLAKRFHTTPAEIKKLNPGIGNEIEPGTKLKFKRKVVPNAKAWVA
ncbi:MAG: hypothetical protein JWO69_1260 [Thermoleophilia bacterium]|jgi:LysM repeat protein|nr:hypothetical protein [Thermoleophilia bacterium]